MKRIKLLLPACVLVAALLLSSCSSITGTDGSDSESSASSSGVDSNGDQSTAGPFVSDGITFSKAGGLYEQPFSLSLSTSIKNGVIRYTTDGSDPTNESAQYTEEIMIEDRTGDDNLLSAIVTSGSGGGFGGGGGGMRDDGGTRGQPPQDNGQPPQMPADDAGQPPQLTADNMDATAGIEVTQLAAPGNGDWAGGPGGGGTAAAPAENVFKGTVIKAAVFSEKGEMLSGVSVQSYFVSEDIFTRYGDLPIVSVVTDAGNFYDSETGIYTNYNQSGSDWERPVYFEMFEADGTSVISQSMGVRINGGTTRSLAQKALRFYAKKDYDEENPTIEYELFDGLTKSYSDDILTTFKRIILRSSGNDNSGSLFRDALMQSLVSDLNVDTQASRPCIAFVNGEFWGIYNIRERYDDHYFAGHYDIDRENVAVLEISQGSKTPEINEGDEGDLAYYNEMVEFFNNNSMTTEANYLKAQEYVDADNIIDYFITNIYSGNTDWPANNNVFWRYKTSDGGYDGAAEWYMDGRFRWVIKDMDWGFGLRSDVTGNTLLHALNESSSSGGRGGMGFTSAESTLMFRKLLENEEFKAKFINRFCDVMNTNYDTDTAAAAINAMKDEIAVAIPEQANRYPSSVSSVSSWESSVSSMISFAQQRAGYVQGFLQSRFSLSNVVTVSVKTDSGSGYIRINDTDIKAGTRGVSDASLWSGSYFAGTTQTFTAVPESGHSFVKFIVTDTASGTTTEYTDSVIEVLVGSGGTTVQAVFG